MAGYPEINDKGESMKGESMSKLNRRQFFAATVIAALPYGLKEIAASPSDPSEPSDGVPLPSCEWWFDEKYEFHYLQVKVAGKVVMQGMLFSVRYRNHDAPSLWYFGMERHLKLISDKEIPLADAKILACYEFAEMVGKINDCVRTCVYKR